MLGAIAGGGDPFEIIVAIRDLAGAGFAKVRSEITATERAANATNLSGVSKAAKNVEKDAEAAAGAEGKGGIGGLASGLVGLAGGPVTLAVAALGAAAFAGVKLTETYDSIQAQEKALSIAAKDHAIDQNALNGMVEASIRVNEQYGFGADDTRGAIIKLTEAGMSLADQQAAMGPITDLARAKNISLTDAAKAYELALMGNARALKEFGIALPKVGAEQAAVTKATTAANSASLQLTNAQNSLKLTEDALAGKHKLTAAEALRLQIAHEKVTLAQQKLRQAQANLTAAQEKANATGVRSETINQAITKAVGGQKAATSEMNVVQAKLGDAWQKLATVVGPPLEALFAGVLNVVAFLIDKFSDLLTWLGKVGDAIANSPIGGFIKSVSGFVGGVAGKLGDVIGSIGNMLPHFASGGAVEPRAGGTLAVIGEAGEREWVIPQSRLGSIGGGGTIVLHSHLHLDSRIVAEQVDVVRYRTDALAPTTERGF